MRRPWAAGRTFGRGWLGQLGAWVALLGFLFSAATPGLALVSQTGRAIAVTGMLGVYVCHARDGERADLPGDESSAQDCCLVCQAAQLTVGAAPPQHFTLPTESAVPIRWSAGASGLHDGEAWRHAQARAPPFA